MLVFDYGPLLYTKAQGRNSDAPPADVLTSRPTVRGTFEDGNGKRNAEKPPLCFVSAQFLKAPFVAHRLLDPQAAYCARVPAR